MLLCELPHMYAFRLVSPWLLHPHVSTFDACSFCSALDFRCAYIRLEKHVCFTSSYIDFNYCLSPTCTWLKSSTPSITSELRKLLDPRFTMLSTWMYLEDYFRGTFDSATPLRLLGSAYTRIQLEIPGPWQKASAAHELKPLSRHPRLRNRETQPTCWVA